MIDNNVEEQLKNGSNNKNHKKLGITQSVLSYFRNKNISDEEKKRNTEKENNSYFCKYILIRVIDVESLKKKNN